MDAERIPPDMTVHHIVSEISDHADFSWDGQSSGSEARTAIGEIIKAALTAERERCAKIAEIYAGDNGLRPASGWSSEEADWWLTGVADGSLAIAAAIRTPSPATSE